MTWTSHGRTVHDRHRTVGVMDTPELAARVCAALNQADDAAAFAFADDDHVTFGAVRAAERRRNGLGA